MRLTPKRQPHSDEQGFSVIYVLIAALVLLAGTVTLINRTSSALFGSAYQGQSQLARDAAKTGMAYLISQLNKKENRFLLAVRQERQETKDEMWSDASAAEFHRNDRCLSRYEPTGVEIPAPAPSIAGVRFDELRMPGGKYFYIQANGEVTTSRGRVAPL